MGRGKDPYYHIEQRASQEAKARGLSCSQRAVVAKAARQAAERAAEEAVVRTIAAEVPRGVQRAVVTPKPPPAAKSVDRVRFIPAPLSSKSAGPDLSVQHSKAYWLPQGPPDVRRPPIPSWNLPSSSSSSGSQRPAEPAHPPKRGSVRSRSPLRRTVRIREEVDSEGEFIEEL